MLDRVKRDNIDGLKHEILSAVFQIIESIDHYVTDEIVQEDGIEITIRPRNCGLTEIEVNRRVFVVER